MVEKAVTVSLPSIKKNMKGDLFCKTRNHNFKCKIRAFWSPNLLGTLVGNFTTTYIMARKLTHQTLCDLHSCCHTLVRSRWFYSEFWAHNVWNVQVVKYLVVWGQTKATDPKYCQNEKWRWKTYEISFRIRGFGENLDDFWPRYCGKRVFDYNHVVDTLLLTEFTTNS